LGVGFDGLASEIVGVPAWNQLVVRLSRIDIDPIRVAAAGDTSSSLCAHSVTQRRFAG